MSHKVELKSQWKGKEIKIAGKKVTGKSAYEIGLIVEGQAKTLAARKYGYLAASITTQTLDGGTELESPSRYKQEEQPAGHNVSTFRKIKSPTDDSEVLVGTAVDYAVYQEFGTKYMDAQPFLRPALDLAKGKVLTVQMKNGKFEFRDYLSRQGQK